MHGRPKGQRLHSSFPPPPPHRPSLGGSSDCNSPREAAAAVAAEETLNLVSGNNAPAFSMIIRLAPDLVEEIKRVEAQGGRVRMKFDSNPYNSGGNIIDVGGKQFRFTWSREFGDLCDIYEEHQSGEDGNGLLVESGCAWRKLNVQRILDESTKNLVKMRSEEAERKLKSRRAIVLEPGNPSMRNQIQALATVEATQRKNYNKKNKVALKKRKVETLQVGGPPKSTYKPGSTSTTATKGRHSSLLSSPPDQSAASSSPLGAVNISKSIDEGVPSQMIGMQDTNAGSKKEIPTRTNNAMRNTPRGKGNNIAEPIDLHSMLISLLMNKPNGLTLKALEKAVQDIVPNPIKKIEPIVRKIAKYKSPGRYILLPGVDLESFMKPQTKSGSSPDDNQRQLPAHQEFCYHTPAPRGGLKEIVPNDDLEELVQLNSKVEEESNTLEKINVQHASPDIFSEKKGSDHSEGQGGSFSNSGSDSESDSSDSGSGSGCHSRSRSRSPAGTGSGSSSDCENDASSNSKEGSDEDVDIMTRDDEKESKYKIEASYQKVSSLIPVKSPDGRSLQYEIHEKRDDGSNGSKQSLSMVSHCLKQGEMVGKLNDGRQGKYLYIGTSPKDNNRISLDKSPVINGRGFSLQRELSNLGLGEFRESTPDETHVTKQFEIKNSFGHLENRANGSEEGNPNVVKPSVKATLESRKPSPAFLSSGFPNNLESTNKKNSDDHFEDSTRSHARVMQSHPQHLKAVNVEIGSQNKLAEMNGRFRSNESGVSQAIDLEGCSESSRRAPANAFKQHDTKRGTVPYPVKESKRQTPNSLEEVADRGKDSGFADKNNSDQKRRESSSDEDSCPYSKYEKDEPELKGPIMTFSQYKEYVQEFHEKYDCYSSLRKIVESYRNEFYDIGKDLKYFKDKDVDRYNDILGQLKESYLRYGMEHKRQKKIHLVLHLELEQLKRRIEDFVHSYNKK